MKEKTNCSGVLWSDTQNNTVTSMLMQAHFVNVLNEVVNELCCNATYSSETTYQTFLKKGTTYLLW